MLSMKQLRIARLETAQLQQKQTCLCLNLDLNRNVQSGLGQHSSFSKIAFKRVRSNAVVASHSKALPK